jgi:hypothetical protein
MTPGNDMQAFSCEVTICPGVTVCGMARYVSGCGWAVTVAGEHLPYYLEDHELVLFWPVPEECLPVRVPPSTRFEGVDDCVTIFPRDLTFQAMVSTAVLLDALLSAMDAGAFQGVMEAASCN